MKNITSRELVKNISIGWNLGNTMDASGTNNITSETSWGNPKTTKELITAIKNSGFNVLRLPTTWGTHLGLAPDYKIDDNWISRVQEIIDYAIQNEMFVILNAHHEDWYCPYYWNAEVAKDILYKVWEQIAERFKDYDEKLIFEGLNEPRQIGTAAEWNGGNEEGWEVVNQLNDAFIKVIRKSRGNNPLRHLMITPYAATTNIDAWNYFIVPNDDKVIISIHAYIPENFALKKEGTDKWSALNQSDTFVIDKLVDNISDKFLSRGVPVLIGEFGAVIKNNNIKARSEWAEYFVSKTAEKNIPCIWWDNGKFEGSGELFGLIDRTTYQWKDPEVINALMRGLNKDKSM
ncbi:MAG: glycoside hydrolase family 5 protein [Mobilitalea sp.]